MVLREDFYSILERTLKDYYRVVQKKDIKISAVAHRLSNRIYIYPRIGIIMTRVPSRDILEYLLNEYNVRNSVLKYTLAKIYVLCCFISKGFLASRSLYISDDSIFSNSDAIIPANRKIRIFNFQEKYVDAIIKDGFTSKFFNNELNFRINHLYGFIPPIQEYGRNWYREEILPGQPLARIKDPILYETSVRQALDGIGQIAQKTCRMVDPVHYVTGLLGQIEAKLTMARDRKRINCYDKVLSLVRMASASAVTLGGDLPLVTSHGDLQSGNIWVDRDRNKTYVIDWETHEERSIWYDCATLLLSTRRAGKLREMMCNRNNEQVKKAIFINDSRKDYNMLAVMGILTLEDIAFYLDDLLELPQNWGGDIFNRIANELESMGWENLS